MNKKLLATAIAATVTLSMGTAFAAEPVNVSSSFKYEFRNNDDASGKVTKDRFYVGINLDGKIDANTTYFGRIAGKMGDFGTAPADSQFKLDQYGVKVNLDGWNVSLGRQGAQLGQGGTFYAGGDIAPLSYYDGLVVTNKIGDVNFKAIGGKTTDVGAPGHSPRQKWYGAEVSGDVDKNINVGLAYAGKSNVGTPVTPETHYWSAYTTIKTGDSLTWTGEYVKSNANTNNRAYDISGTYAWTKNSFTVAYNNVQTNSTDTDNSVIGGEYYPNGDAFTAGYKGLTYVYHHDVTKALGFNLIFLSLEPMTGGHTNKELAANLKWKF